MTRKGRQMRMKLGSVADNLPSPDVLMRQKVEAAKVILANRPDGDDLACQWARKVQQQNLGAARTGESTPTV
jgi:hypothetical protein